MRIMVDLDNTLADYTHALRHHLRSTNVYGPLDGYAMADPCEYGLWRDPSWPFASYEAYADAHRSAVTRASTGCGVTRHGRSPHMRRMRTPTVVR